VKENIFIHKVNTSQHIRWTTNKLSTAARQLGPCMRRHGQQQQAMLRQRCLQPSVCTRVCSTVGTGLQGCNHTVHCSKRWQQLMPH
jgi:hypothetical protein